MALQVIYLGQSAGDGKGDLLYNAMQKTNQNFVELYNWIGGATGSLVLPNFLPVSRGGTGSTSVQGARKNMGLYVDVNGGVVFGYPVVDLFNHKADCTDAALQVGFSRTAVGKYELTNTKGLGINGFKMVLPKDDLGMPLFGAVLSYTDGLLRISTYKTKIDTTAGKVVVDTSKPMDIPAGSFMNIHIKGY